MQCPKGAISAVSNVCSMAKREYDWPPVLAFRETGHTIAECAQRFGFHPDAWYKAIKRGVITPAASPQNRGARLRYDWNAIQRYYDEGHTYRECRLHFGFAADSWARAVRSGRLLARGQELPLAVLLARSDRSTIKRRLLDAGILKNTCDECRISEWRGRPLSVQIDHVNGNGNDHRFENLRMLCPNCHSQTATFGGRNSRKRFRVAYLVAPTGFEPVLPS